jgi:hypothetical protein
MTIVKSGKARAAHNVQRATTRADTNSAVIPRIMNAGRLGIAGKNSATPLPARFKANLRYSGTFSLTTAAITGSSSPAHIFSLSSLFDPDATAFGHFPYGFDQLKVLYSKYCVYNTKFRIIASTIGGTAEIGIHAAVMTPNGFSALGGLTFDACCERDSVSTVLVSPSGNSRVAEIFGKVNIASVLGVTSQGYRGAESLYAALVTANPTLAPTLSVAASSPSGTGGESVTVTVVLDYESEFFEPIVVAQST